MLHWLTDDCNAFPPVEEANQEGLLAIGGDLSSDRIIAAYQHGIFPWYQSDTPILWWCPDPRTVLYPAQCHISKSLKKIIRQQVFTIRYNTAFDQVIEACSTPRQAIPTTSDHTWLQPEMIAAYQRLHRQGIAHSVECWHNDTLVGGLYGLQLGGVFFGESMFSLMSNSSKVALASLCHNSQAFNIQLIDCQVHSDHLMRLGATTIPRQDFITLIQALIPTIDISSSKWPSYAA